jgi:flagellar basal body P-ring formation protein FlgA
VRIAGSAFLVLALSLTAVAAESAPRERLEASAVAAVAREHLRRALARDHEQVLLEAIPDREAILLPAGAVTLESRACGPETPARRMCVRVDVLVDGVRRKSLPVWFRVQARRRVLVASEALAAGSAFDARAFAVELRDVAALRGAPLLPGQPAGALRLRRPLERGEALLARDVAPAPAVARNQEVTIRVRTGTILVEAPGVALAEGNLGAVIRVRNPRSGEIYQARVVEDGVLAVSY